MDTFMYKLYLKLHLGQNQTVLNQHNDGSRWFESSRIWAAGLIVGEVSTRACHWRARRSLGAWLAARGVPGLCDIDTRALTYRLRSGVMLGRIVQGVPPFGPLPPLSDPNTRNLVAEVSIKVINKTFENIDVVRKATQY